MRVFVKNMRGEPLMPCSSRKARILIKQNKAVIVSYQPFTIQLQYATGETTQPVAIGVDTGSKYIGIAVTSHEDVLAKGEISLRQDVSSLLTTRRTYRRGRRHRNTRYRRCKWKHQTKRVYHQKKQQWVKEIRTFASSRPAGWLPPSLVARIQNTHFWIDTFTSLLPKASLHIEVGKFDVQKMKQPMIHGKEYQEGETFGYHDVRYFVFARDSYTCQVCKKKNKILNTHHVIYRSHGGGNSASNLIAVCTDCHTSDNHQPGKILWQWMVDKKKTKTYREPPFLHALRQRFYRHYPEARITYGSVTTPHRKTLNLEKTHYNDAIAITGIPTIRINPDSMFVIKQFRKKKRSLHEATARKGRKIPNTTQQRNAKNTKQKQGFYLHDRVSVFGRCGVITGFTAGGAYIKDRNGDYVTVPEKTYKQVSLKHLERLCHQNNWQFISHLPPYGA